MDILYVKSLHIIFVISWFAGLLYISRLFIYHTEAEVRPPEVRQVLRDQFRIMERRLWYVITWPAGILASFFGLWLVWDYGWWSQGWMQVKLILVLLLWVYHGITHWLFLGLQQDVVRWNSLHLRIWNEVATLWMLTIVFVVVLKNALNWIYATLGFMVVAMMLMLGIRLYKKLRKD